MVATARSVRPLLRKSPATSDMESMRRSRPERDRRLRDWNVPSPLPRSTVTSSVPGSATARSRWPLPVKLPATIASGRDCYWDWRKRESAAATRNVPSPLPRRMVTPPATTRIGDGQVDAARCR